MMMRTLAVLSLVASLSMAFAGTAEARSGCSCSTRTPQQYVSDAAAVFSATVSDLRVDEPMLNGGSVTARLRPDHVYKGGLDAEVQVETAAQGAACGYEFVKGARYLVFAGARDRKPATTLCSGNMLIPAGEQPLRSTDKAQGMQPLTPELIAALGTPTRVAAAPPSTPNRTGLPAVVAVMGAVAVAGVAWSQASRWARARHRR
ncbi:hypothetical protein ACIBP6_16570 [Nonomuraea terrae]|uniref:hypothetical protein n=1 Tax=Nonomuraea terrae TaxID=2530383 RepID=UPI0037993F55